MTAEKEINKFVDSLNAEMAMSGDTKVKPADLMFDKQLAIYSDPSKRKVAGCGRRAGKTLYACLLSLIHI